ncbi:DUF4097 family beta strand repeat-containing protein [Acidipila sp. EB88]|uniref:DUF4097 family beta strand repeat-containing protein n=1 Tax=Acidipila sp. EB88 TaxID=2305226 RepID=UPI001F243D44|nr:DUF4097 family beta strand repeat-containing protein [Acidipila sp. EB88]
MKLACSSILLAGTLSLLTPSAFAADGTFERTLKVNGPVLLGIDTDSGNIHVSPGATDSVHIVAHVHSGGGWFGGASEDRIKQIVANPPINQAGNIISLGHNFHANNISIDYEVTTPRGTDLRANSGSGDVRVADNGGPVQLKTGSGNVEATGLSDHVQLETGSGDVKATMLSARDVKATTGSGNIHLANVQCGLWAHTGSGNLDVSGKPLAAWKLETGSGDITADTGGAPLSLNATTGSGDIAYAGGNFKQNGTGKDHVIGDAGGGGPMVRAITGSGNIHLK